MDKFTSAETAPKTVESEKTTSGGKRWLWAASMCSLIGIASASYVLVTDHMRISNLQERMANRRLGSQAMQHVLALANVDIAATTVETGSATGSIDTTATTTTTTTTTTDVSGSSISGSSSSSSGRGGSSSSSRVSGSGFSASFEDTDVSVSEAS